MKNLSFEDGWETLPPTGNAGWLQNQRPNHWQLTILPPGAELWDSTDTATGEPEAVHKGVNQLPPDERPGGSDPLILDGEWVYKIFHSGAAYGVELRQVVEGLQPGSGATAVVRIRVHDHKGTDPYGCEFRMISNGKGGWWHKDAGQLVNFEWVERSQSRTIGDDGRFELIIQLKTKYPLPVDWFLDAFEFSGEYADTEPPVDPPPDPEPPPADHEHPDIDEQLDSLQAQYDALAVFAADLDQRLLVVENGQPPQPEMPVLPPRVLAVDISAHQGQFDWDKAKAGGIRYAILRSSNGLGSTSTDENGRDLQLLRNAAECTRLGIPFSIYHFLQPGQTTAQAGLVNSIWAELVSDGTPPTRVMLKNGRILPPVWCDVESFDLSITSIRLFCEVLACGIYTSAYYWDGISGNAAAWWADYPLWAAHWTGNNNGQIPPETAVPILPRDFGRADLWQFTSKGGALIGWPGGLDINLTGPFTAVTPPPLPGKIDLARYLPQTAVGQWLVMQKSEGGTIDHQLQTKNGVSYLAKSAAAGKTNYEELRLTDTAVERRYDTSPADGKPYKLDDQAGSGWSMWCKRFVNVGDVIERRPYVSRYEPGGDCSRISGPELSVSYLKVAGLHTSWRGAADGKLYNEVLELHWLFAPVGAVVEKYFIAPGRWYVGWESPSEGEYHYAVDEPQGRPPLPLSVIGCLK